MKKRNKMLIITAVLFVITGIAFLITGYALSGHDIIAWFSSKWAMMFYLAFALYAIIVGTILIGDLIKRI